MKTQEGTITKLKDSTISKEFRPTPAMWLWLDVDCRLLTDNLSEIERESKITAQSWHGWQKLPGFIDWYNNEWNKRLKGQGSNLDKIGLRNARRDFKYWEGMQKRVGNLQDQNTNIQINNIIPILGGKSNALQGNNRDTQDIETE